MQAHFFLMLLAIISLTSCKSHQPAQEDHHGNWMVIGHGGGFTGQTIEYQIAESGKVIRRNSLTNSEEEMKSITKDAYIQIESNYEKLGLDKIQLNQPDNMYYYVIFFKEGYTHKIVWNNNDESEVQAKLQLFFNTVLHRVKS